MPREQNGRFTVNFSEQPGMAEEHDEISTGGMMRQCLERSGSQAGPPLPSSRFGKDQDHSGAAGVAPNELGPESFLRVIAGTRWERTSDIIVHYHEIQRTRQG